MQNRKNVAPADPLTPQQTGKPNVAGLPASHHIEFLNKTRQSEPAKQAR